MRIYKVKPNIYPYEIKLLLCTLEEINKKYTKKGFTAVSGSDSCFFWCEEDAEDFTIWLSSDVYFEQNLVNLVHESSHAIIKYCEILGIALDKDGESFTYLIDYIFGEFYKKLKVFYKNKSKNS
jgi:hypothetical protein